jgi:hypothetical protein
MTDSPVAARFSMLAGEIIRPVISLFIACAVLRRRFLTLAAIYLSLRIIVPLLLAFRVPQVFGWSFAPIVMHVLALVGVIYIRRFNEPNVA